MDAPRWRWGRPFYLEPEMLSPDARGCASRRGVMQRASGEWSEAGAENSAGIDEIGVTHNTFGQCRFRLGDIGRNKALSQSIGRTRFMLLDRLAIRVIVKP